MSGNPSGKPKGTRARVTQLAEKLLEIGRLSIPALQIFPLQQTSWRPGQQPPVLKAAKILVFFLGEGKRELVGEQKRVRHVRPAFGGRVQLDEIQDRPNQ